MKKDKFVFAALLGAAATVVAELVSLLLVSLGFGTLDIYRLDSLVITTNRPTLFFGFLANCVVGGVAGILLLYSMEKYKPGCVLARSIMLSFLFWFVFKLYDVAFIIGKTVEIKPIATYYSHVICVLVNGLTLGLLFMWMMRKKEVKGEAHR